MPAKFLKTAPDFTPGKEYNFMTIQNHGGKNTNLVESTEYYIRNDKGQRVKCDIKDVEIVTKQDN